MDPVTMPIRDHCVAGVLGSPGLSLYPGVILQLGTRELLTQPKYLEVKNTKYLV